MIAINKSRRRLLKIVGITAVGAVVGKSFVTFKDKDELKKVSWNGTALGSQAEITIYHPNEKEAQKILRKSVGELAGLENLFSLYKDSSQLSLLNKKGYLENPHPEMVNIFNLSKKVLIENGCSITLLIKMISTLSHSSKSTLSNIELKILIFPPNCFNCD